jgi:hypothetical protein
MSFNQPLTLQDVVAQGTLDTVTVDEAAMQYSLVAIEIFGVLCAGPLLRGACAADAAQMETLDEALATLRDAETTLYGIADCGSERALDAYVSAHEAIGRVGELLLKHRLFFAAAVLPGTTRAFARFDHDAVAAVENALKNGRYVSNFHIRSYVEYRRISDPAIAPLGR